jgi:uncharacterized protein YndB with AHSA1/START domain
MSTDRIEKQILLRATLKRVWRALSDSTEFGTWFGMRFDGPFAPGVTMHAVLVPTSVDTQVAKAQQKYQGLSFEITIEQMEPERLLSFRWHPNAVDPGVDYSVEPTTLVVFTLEQVANDVLLTVTESGFDQLPLARRARAFNSNEQGWSIQVKMIEGYLVQAP